MKILLLAVCTLFISTLSFAQCDAPVVTDWTFVDSVTVEISLEMLGESSDFEMEFVSIYSDAFNGPPLGEALIFSNSFDQVNQTFLFSLSGLASQTETSIPEVNYYYEVQLRSICGSDSSSVYRFYVSPHSLLSDPAFEESPLQFNVISFLPDGLGESYVTNVQVPPSYSNQLIDSVFVLLDIGHTYNGDLDITLTSPSGIEVALLSFPNSLGGASGLSVLFKDGAAPQSDSPSNSLRGVYAPAGDLSDLVGEQIVGNWQVTVTDNLGIDSGYLFGIGLYINSSPCEASITGTSFIDYDVDGLQGGNEPPLSYAALDISSYPATKYSNSDGVFSYCVPTGTGSVTAVNLPQYYAAIPASIDYDLGLEEYATGLDFALQATEDITDVSVSIHSLTPDRPGFENTYYLGVNNIGSLCQDVLNLSATLDANINILSVSDPSVTIDGNTLTWSLTDFCPFQEHEFEAIIEVAETVMIGDTLTSTIATIDLFGDVDYTDNVGTLENIVVGSYDPNDIAVDKLTISPSYSGPGADLEYKIRFQNTGNYYAERVLIIDDLPTELDAASISIQTSSHPMEFSRIGQTLYFEFDDIFLPDSSTDQLASNGFVIFQCNNTAVLNLGDVIENEAEIYFDFNEAIHTNMAETTVEDVLSLDEQDHIKIGLYPNPTTDLLRVQWEDNLTFKQAVITEVDGRQVKTFDLRNQSQTAVFSLGELTQGIYLITLRGEQEVSRTFLKR